MTERPPRLARALLRLLLPAANREYILGDLAEEYRRHVRPALSRRAARRWYWGQALASLAPALAGPRPRQAPVREGEGMLGSLRGDLTYGLRSLLRAPGMAAAAVTTLALGIGAVSAIFSVVDGVLLKPLPYADPGRLVRVWEHDRELDARSSVSIPTFRDWREESGSFAAMAAYSSLPATLTGDGDPEHLTVAVVSPDLFGVLGVAPALGRAFGPRDEAENTASVLLTHRLWQSRFGGRDDVLGETLTLDGELYTVAGVLPRGLDFPSREVALWRPLYREALTERRGVHILRVLARLAPEATLARAQADLATVARRLETAYPDTMEGYGVEVVPLTESVVGEIRPRLLMLLGAVTFVLLIACANVANLLLARATARQREVAVRSALGAGRRRLTGQFLTESLLLAGAGALAGLGLAYGGIAALKALAPEGIPRLEEVTVDLRVFGFSLAAALLTGVAFGLAPAFRAARADASRALQGGRGGGESAKAGALRSTLVVFQVAAALVLLAGAGLLVQSFARLLAVDPGFAPRRLLTLHVTLPESEYRTEEGWPQGMPRVVAFQDALLERLGSLPGVESAALALNHPLAPGWTTSFESQGLAPREEPFFRPVSPGYFRTAGIPLLRGRGFSELDGPEAPGVVIINDAMARRWWPDADPLGQVLRQWGEEFTVVGVVGDVKFLGQARETAPAFYFPISQRPMYEVSAVVRTAGDPLALAEAVRRQVWAVDPHLAVFGTASLEDLLARSLGQPRFYALLLGLFAGVAVTLAAVGLYGVLAYTVARRTREIGIRIAVGARRSQVLALVVGRGMLLVGLGVVVGLAGALALTRVLTSLLFDVSPGDPWTLAAVVLLLAAVALLASLLPARRASRVDPVTSLRVE